MGPILENRLRYVRRTPKCQACGIPEVDRARSRCGLYGRSVGAYGADDYWYPLSSRRSMGLSATQPHFVERQHIKPSIYLAKLFSRAARLRHAYVRSN